MVALGEEGWVSGPRASAKPQRRQQLPGVPGGISAPQVRHFLRSAIQRIGFLVFKSATNSLAGEPGCWSVGVLENPTLHYSITPFYDQVHFTRSLKLRIGIRKSEAVVPYDSNEKKGECYKL